MKMKKKMIIKAEEIQAPKTRTTFADYGLLNPCTRVVPAKKGKRAYNRAKQKRDNRLYMWGGYHGKQRQSHHQKTGR